MFKKIALKLFFSESRVVNPINIFDLSSRERVRLLRAAGKSAQKEQKQLVSKYDSMFGTAH